MNWGAVVLAGGTVDPVLAEVLGTDRKALAMCEGRSCLARTLAAVRDAGIKHSVAVGPEEVQSEVHFGDWVAEGSRQMVNARKGVDHFAGVDELLFLPSDSPLLSGDGLRHFLSAVERRRTRDRWLAAGVCPAAVFESEFPEVPTQAVRIREGRFVSGAYYAASRDAFFGAMDIVAVMAESRKSQFGMLRRLGLGTLLKAVTGRLRLAEGEARVSQLMGAEAFAILDCDAAAMVDIDTPEDWRAVQAIFARRGA